MQGLLIQPLGVAVRSPSRRRDVPHRQELVDTVRMLLLLLSFAALARRLNILLDEVRYPLHKQRPDHGMDVVVAHPLNEEGSGAVRGLHHREELLGVMERYDLILGAVDEHDGTSDVG